MRNDCLMDERAESVLKFIIRYKKQHDGVAPSIRDIRQGCGIPSTSSVKYVLDLLEEGQVIRRVDGSRGIMVNGGNWVFVGQNR